MFVIALQGDPARLVAVLALQLAGPHPFVKVESGVQVGFECASHGAKPATVVEYRSTPFRYVWPAELDNGPARRTATARAVGRVDTGDLHE